MPRSYERKTAHSYTEYDLKMALFLVQEGNYGARCVARSTGVPLSTLKRKLKTNSPAQRNVFNKIQEAAMATDIKSWCSQRKRVLKQILGYVYQKGKYYDVNFPATWHERQEAGTEWWQNFKKRNLSSSFSSFLPLRCAVCRINVKSTNADFVECPKCGEFSCNDCFVESEIFCCKNF